MNILGLLKRKEWSQCHRESSWQARQVRFCQKEKEQSRQSRVSDRERGENQGEREPHVGEKEGDRDLASLIISSFVIFSRQDTFSSLLKHLRWIFTFIK